MGPRSSFRSTSRDIPVGTLRSIERQGVSPLVRAGSPKQSGKDDVMYYRATYQFDGRGWICQFVDPDIATFGRTLAVAKTHARSLLAVYLEVGDLAAAGVAIEDEIRLPAGIDVEIDDLARQRDQAETLRREVATATRSAAAKLRAAGFSTRDVGELIGVSGARVGQLENGPHSDVGPSAK
jgi:hypothetical protein